jgi:hypothetical protein
MSIPIEPLRGSGYADAGVHGWGEAPAIATGGGSHSAYSGEATVDCANRIDNSGAAASSDHRRALLESGAGPPIKAPPSLDNRFLHGDILFGVFPRQISAIGGPRVSLDLRGRIVAVLGGDAVRLRSHRRLFWPGLRYEPAVYWPRRLPERARSRNTSK